MSDRAVILPYPGDLGWADLVIDPSDPVETLVENARVFAAMPGPHKVFCLTREAPTVIAFLAVLEFNEVFHDVTMCGRTVCMCPLSYDVIVKEAEAVI